jgi:hypothetical protein
LFIRFVPLKPSPIKAILSFSPEVLVLVAKEMLGEILRPALLTPFTL